MAEIQYSFPAHDSKTYCIKVMIVSGIKYFQLLKLAMETAFSIIYCRVQSILGSSTNSEMKSVPLFWVDIPLPKCREGGSSLFPPELAL